MLDLKELRKDPKGLETKLKNKIAEIDLSPILRLDERIRALKTEVEELKAKRNHSSKEIGLKKQKGEDVSPFMAEMSRLADEIALRDTEVTRVEADLQGALAILPNIPLDEID